MDVFWNPWHGCHKVSPGCHNCYVYRIDGRCGRDPAVVAKTAAYGLPVALTARGRCRVPPGSHVYTCLSSDFFVEEADAWRPGAWKMMRLRPDLHFWFTTKRPERFHVGLPDDWGEGYANVTVCVSCENQQMADRRIPLLRALPLRRRMVLHEPLLGPIDLEPHLAPAPGLARVDRVACGGESGPGARLCRYEWVLGLRDACARYGVDFTFRQTGALLALGDRVYRIPRRLQAEQARKAGIDLRFGRAGDAIADGL